MAINFNAKGGIEITKNMQITAEIAALSVVFFIVLYSLLILPGNRKTQEIAKRYQTISKVNISDVQRLQAEHDRLAQEQAALESEIVSIQKMLTEQKNISSILDRFIENAKKRQMEFTYIKPMKSNTIVLGTSKNEAENITMLEMPISLKLEAGFTDFLLFLWDTEHVDKTLKITQLGIDRTDSARHTESIDINILQLQETPITGGK